MLHRLLGKIARMRAQSYGMQRYVNIKPMLELPGDNFAQQKLEMTPPA